MELVVCVAGMVKADEKECELDEGQDIADLIPIAIANGPMSLEDSMANASELISETIYRVVQLYLHTKGASHDQRHKL